MNTRESNKTSKIKEEAIAQGLKHYFTGKPCKHGHVSKRRISTGICLECSRDAHYSKEEIKEINRNNHDKHRPRDLFLNARSRARYQGLDFNIEKEDIIIPEVCPILGIPLDSRNIHHTPSLDRMNPDKGYIKGNVDVISLKANRLKNNGTLDDFERIVKYMKEKEYGC